MLFDFLVNGDLVEIRIVFLHLETVGSVLLVLGGDIAGDTGNTALLLFGAFQNDLHSVTFLCHSCNALNDTDKSFFLGSLYRLGEAVLVDSLHTAARNLEGNESLLFL